MSELPEALVPVAPPPATALSLVGSVCGQEIWARTELVEKARALTEQLKSSREYWPADALHATILALRLGLSPQPTYREIAQMLNMSERHVLRTVKRGKGADVVTRELRRLDQEGAPMAVENVLDGLERKDKDYTLEYLKGRGMLNPKAGPATGTEGEAAGVRPPGLVVQFIHTTATPEQIKQGSITAVPNRTIKRLPDVVVEPA